MAKNDFQYGGCNVARSWHWFRQVTAPCNVACGSGIMTVNSPSGSSAALCNVIRGSGMEFAQTFVILEFLEFHIWFRFWPYHRSWHVILHQSPIFYPNQTTLSGKKTSCRFSRWRISAILDFRGPIMGSFKSSCTTSYRSSVETIALNCLVFEKIVFFAFYQISQFYSFL